MSVSTEECSGDANGSGRDRAVDASRATRERMLEAMCVLETALAKPAPQRESAWRTAVLSALAVLERAMSQQSAELNGETGLLADIQRDEPRLENRIVQLRRQQKDLLRQIRSLREEFSSEDAEHPPDIADIRQRLAWLLGALRHFQSRETDLIYEAIQVDIGPMD